jgi:predicted nucleotidyltransferase
MSVPKQIVDSYPELSRTILSGYRGSIAHGMYVPPKNPTSIDDKDVMYVVVPEVDFYFGYPEEFGSNKIFPTNGTKEIKHDEWDIVAYEAKKFIGLLAQGNPNVLAMLWLKPQYYLTVTNAGQMILDNRKLFVGRHVYKSFTGYAYGQLHRMTHNAFMGHLGEKRKRLVEQFGFDCKNAAHLIRLLRMGIEFLKDGELQVEREDASQLLGIKRGEWSLEKINAEAERLFASAEQSYLNSTLPAKIDSKAVNDLSIAVIQTAMKELNKER